MEKQKTWSKACQMYIPLAYCYMTVNKHLLH